MRELSNPQRVIGMMDRIIAALELDLTGLTVLTETGSGPFVCTPLIAARAGANVIAVTRDSVYGAADEVLAYSRAWAERCGVSDHIKMTVEPVARYAATADILTNLGFLRPITAEVVDALPEHAAIPLMWEAWEFRPEDLDLAACRRRGIPVVGTCETHPALRIFDYLGAVVAKLLLQVEIEIVRSRLALISTDPFGEAIARCLTGMGAQVERVDIPWPGNEWLLPDPTTLDALIVAEHRGHRKIVGDAGGVPPDYVARIGTPLIHLCGSVDSDALSRSVVAKHPAKEVKPRYMTVTTDYCGPRPVIDLHAGGFKVAEILVRARKSGMTPRQAVGAVAATGLASLLPEELA